MDCIKEMQKNLSKMTRYLMRLESELENKSQQKQTSNIRQKEDLNYYKSRKRLSHFKKILNRVKKIFAFNEYEEILREDLVDVLELEEFTDYTFIQKSLDQLIREGILYEPRKNYLKFVKQKGVCNTKILDVQDFKLFPISPEESKDKLKD